jgi:hypothetical protein
MTASVLGMSNRTPIPLAVLTASLTMIGRGRPLMTTLISWIASGFVPPANAAPMILSWFSGRLVFVPGRRPGRRFPSLRRAMPGCIAIRSRFLEGLGA